MLLNSVVPAFATPIISIPPSTSPVALLLQVGGDLPMSSLNVQLLGLDENDLHGVKEGGNCLVM